VRNIVGAGLAKVHACAETRLAMHPDPVIRPKWKSRSTSVIAHTIQRYRCRAVADRSRTNRRSPNVKVETMVSLDPAMRARPRNARALDMMAC
jgi:hypothetical protein